MNLTELEHFANGLEPQRRVKSAQIVKMADGSEKVTSFELEDRYPDRWLPGAGPPPGFPYGWTNEPVAPAGRTGAETGEMVSRSLFREPFDGETVDEPARPLQDQVVDVMGSDLDLVTMVGLLVNLARPNSGNVAVRQALIELFNRHVDTNRTPLANVKAIATAVGYGVVGYSHDGDHWFDLDGEPCAFTADELIYSVDRTKGYLSRLQIGPDLPR